MKFQKEADWHPSMNRTVSVNVTLMFLVLGDFGGDGDQTAE